MTFETTTGYLAAEAPFDWSLSLRILQRFPVRPEAHVVAGRRLRRGLSAAGRVLLAQVEPHDAATLRYTLWASQPIPAAVQAAAAGRLAFSLSLADDLNPFYAAAQADPPFQPVLASLYGYHQVKFATPFEAACWAILAQRNQFPTAQKMHRALIEAYGERVALDDHVYPIFPEPEAVVAAGPPEVARAIGHRPKGQLVWGVARAWLEADEAWLRTAPYPEAEAWLRRIQGIGPWSASFVLIRGLGRMEHVPANDRWLDGLVSERYGPVPVAAAARRYGEHQGYWAHYLRAAAA